MAELRTNKVEVVETHYDIADLNAFDLRVLDLALSYFKDTVIDKPHLLTVSQKSALYKLHNIVLEIKRGEE